MQNEVGLSCQLRQARLRWNFDPAHCNLDRDICDITMWLLDKYQEPYLHLWIDRYYCQNKFLIAPLLWMCRMSGTNY